MSTDKSQPYIFVICRPPNKRFSVGMDRDADHYDGDFAMDRCPGRPQTPHGPHTHSLRLWLKISYQTPYNLAYYAM